MDILILAAGKSSRVYKDIKTHKCLIKINNQTLIERIVNISNSEKTINKIHIVTGFLSNKIKNELKSYKVNFIKNPLFKKKDMVHSIKLGLKKIDDDVIISYSDVFYSKKLLHKIIKNMGKKIILPVNKRWLEIWKIRKKDPFLDCETLKYNNKLELKEIGNKIKSIKDVMGQFMGLIFIPKNELLKFKNLINKNKDKNIQTTELINISIKSNIKIKVLENKSFWYEFDDYHDVKNFKKF